MDSWQYSINDPGLLSGFIVMALLDKGDCQTPLATTSLVPVAPDPNLPVAPDPNFVLSISQAVAPLPQQVLSLNLFIITS